MAGFRDLTSWLVTLAGPLVKKVLVSIGIGVVSYAGVTAGVNTALDSAKSVWAGMPADVVTFMAMSGVNNALGIITAAILARIAMSMSDRLGLVTGT